MKQKVDCITFPKLLLGFIFCVYYLLTIIYLKHVIRRVMTPEMTYYDLGAKLSPWVALMALL